MLTLRIKLLNGVDRVLAVALVALLLGTSMAFGGAVWWARTAVVFLTLVVAMAWLARVAIGGQWRILKSPMSALALLAIGLGIAQLLPLPAGLVDLVSSRSLSVNSVGLIPDQALADDPSAELPPPFLARSPLTVDRPATLRWIVGATACLGLFWVCSHYSDRLNHARVIWGSVVAAFFLNAVLGAVQVTSHSSGLYGSIIPGSGPMWAPTVDDALNAPTATVLRPVGVPKPDGPSIAAARPSKPFLIGTLMGGPGAFLALGSLALPLAFGLALQMMSPRGSREGLMARLRDSGQGSQFVLMIGLIVAGSVLVGIMAGPWPSVPFAAGMMVVGLLGSWSAGLRKYGLLMSVVILAAIAAGVAIGGEDARMPRVAWHDAQRTWAESWPIVRDFPVVGTGLGTFSSIHPYYKTGDAASGTAMSSALQWVVESGGIGLILVAFAGLWCLWRLPGAIARVGRADRPLAFGLFGSLGCFLGFSAIHWTVDLTSVALAASAVAGTGNRWLAGGTDLFVERD